MLAPSSRGHVPVLRRRSGSPSASSDSASAIDGGAPLRPPGSLASPTNSTPRRNVPAVITAQRADTRPRRASTAPVTRRAPASRSIASAVTSSSMIAPGGAVAASSCCICAA